MKSRKTQKEIYCCQRCSFIAESQEELDLHYELTHDENNDLTYEYEYVTRNRISLKGKKGLIRKMLKDLDLLINGTRNYINDYVGWCEYLYGIDTWKEKNVIKIDLIVKKMYC